MPSGRETLHPISPTGNLCVAQLTWTQAGVGLCPLPAEEAEMDGQTDPVGLMWRCSPQAFFSQIVYGPERVFLRAVLHSTHSFDKPPKEKQK